MKKHRKCKKIIAFVTVLFIAFVAVIGLHKTGIYRFDFLKDIYKKIDFQLSTNELNIPQDALSFSVYDIEQEEYLFYEGDSQLPTVASLAKLFAIDYALGKVDLEDIVEVNQEVLELVPAGSSLANLYAGEYTVKQIMEAIVLHDELRRDMLLCRFVFDKGFQLHRIFSHHSKTSMYRSTLGFTRSWSAYCISL